MPDSTPNLSSALGEALEQGRQSLVRLESLVAAISSELAARDGTETQLRQQLRAAEQQRSEQTAELVGLREQLESVARDRDSLQAHQLEWGADRERLLADLSQLKARLSELERELGAERGQHAALQARFGAAAEQATKAAADWSARRQALAAEIHAQSVEMEQVRLGLQESQERERRALELAQRKPAPGIEAAPLAPGSAAQAANRAALPAGTPSLNHEINSRLNALLGFSSVLMDERAHPVTPEERREYLKYLHDSAVRLAHAVRPVTGGTTGAIDTPLTKLAKDRPPPDIMVADDDTASRERIEPFLRRAGYEVVYVANAHEALRKAGSIQPLAILIDSQLPPRGAAALVAELRRDPRTREIPLVLMSPADGAPPLVLADCDVLTKPVDRQELVQLMVRFDLMADSKRARKMPANVLVIEDDPHAVSLLKAILKPFNVRVSTVDNARAGIEQAQRNPPDLVILDLVLAGGDGFEVVTALRRDKEANRVPILIHTARTLTAEDRQRLEGKVESIVEKAEFHPERFLELLVKRGERRKRDRPAA